MTRDELETIVYQHMPRVGAEAITHYNVQSIMAAVDQYTVTIASPSVQQAILAHAADQVHGSARGKPWRKVGRRREQAG